MVNGEYDVPDKASLESARHFDTFQLARARWVSDGVRCWLGIVAIDDTKSAHLRRVCTQFRVP